jgi:hypothetical protein
MIVYYPRDATAKTNAESQKKAIVKQVARAEQLQRQSSGETRQRRPKRCRSRSTAASRWSLAAPAASAARCAPTSPRSARVSWSTTCPTRPRLTSTLRSSPRAATAPWPSRRTCRTRTPCARSSTAPRRRSVPAAHRGGLHARGS